MKLAAGGFAAFVLAVQAQAGFIHVWGIGEIDDSPALVVGTVLEVEQKEVLPPGLARTKPPERNWEATLLVHRAFSRQPFVKGAAIKIRFVANPQGGMQTQGSPVWPHFEKGDVALFPLAPAGNGKWRLVADEGFNLTVPALSSPPSSRSANSGRATILSELANTLAHGSPLQRYRAAEYLREARPEPRGFREALEREVGLNDDRWLEVASALLASRGIPHPSIEELMADPNLRGTGNQIAAWALQKGATRDYPDRLVRCLFRNMPAYEWGAANSLLDFKDLPLVTRELTDLLAQAPAGSIYVAWVLVRNGQRTFVKEALEAATRLVSDPASVTMSRLQAAAGLLRDYGTNEQFTTILDTLRRLKMPDENAYRQLFGAVSGTQNRRELRVASILIDDRRAGFGSLRYCDVAAATVERIAGVRLGFNQEMTPIERDRSVWAASAWLSAHRSEF